MKNWEKELVDFINAKAKEHSTPKDRYKYFKLLAELAKHEVEHARRQECYDMMINAHFREEQSK